MRDTKGRLVELTTQLNLCSTAIASLVNRKKELQEALEQTLKLKMELQQELSVLESTNETTKRTNVSTSLRKVLFDLEFYLKDYERLKQQAKEQDNLSSAAYYCGIITGLKRAMKVSTEHLNKKGTHE